MKSVHSTATMNRYKDILGCKDSVSQMLQNTVDGLSNEFTRSEKTAEEVIFELFKLPNKEQGAIGKLIAVLKSYGIQDSDPRLKPMMDIILAIEKKSEERANEAKDPKHWRLSKKISCKLNNDGSVATTIPQLARIDPKIWGVAICTVDGQRTSFGDAKKPFCIQSLSKAFNYAICASDLGADFVHKYVGQEPSGRLFNEICLDSKNIPHNPLISAGAIVIASLLKSELNLADRFDSVLNIYRQIAGGEYVGFNNAVFLSEREHSDRNFALAYYLNEYKCFPPSMRNLGDLMDFYFQLMSLETTTESAAVLAATLANGGICPITDERIIESRSCRDVLSLMHSCGLYDYSGQFAFHVRESNRTFGLAVQGICMHISWNASLKVQKMNDLLGWTPGQIVDLRFVSLLLSTFHSRLGAMLVVIPNLMGVCLYSPPLDELNNSIRGVEFCRELIARFALHNYDNLANLEQNKIDPRKRIGESEKDEIISMLFAARSNDLNAIRRIFIRGVDLNLTDYDQRTPLHVAASEGNSEIVKFLLNVARVKVDPLDRWGRTPLDDSKFFKHANVTAILEKATQMRNVLSSDAGPLDGQLQRAEDSVVTLAGSLPRSLSVDQDRSSTSTSESDDEQSGIHFTLGKK